MSQLVDPHEPTKGAEPTKGTEHEELDFHLPPPAKPTAARLVAFAVLIVAVLGAAFVFGFLPRWRARAALVERAKAAEGQVPKIDVVKPTVVASDRALVLPATIEALEETIIYPRASGYVRSWLVDIGDHVDEGQLLAEIDTPELDRQVDEARAQASQAMAAIAQTKASLDLAKTNVDRAEKLTTGGVTTQQDLDERRGQARVAQANLDAANANAAAAEANVRRLGDLKSFARLVAPFSGVVTSRTIQRGALVSEGPGTPLFKIAILDPMRIVVAVPQDVAPSVKPNVPADLTVREFPGQKFAGTVARSSGALDPMTRTMTTEVRVPNADRKLLAGMYAEVSLTLPSPHRALEIPATALYTDASGQRVAIVDADQRVHFVKVLVERDTGATVIVGSGLDGSERVVKIANVTLTEGLVVETP